MDPAAILSSAVVAALVAGLLSWVRERYLLDRKAEVDYRSNARKRLYEAIGPLRLQLLFAARDLMDRVSGHALEAVPTGRGWNMDVRGYYVQSFVYRILRPLAIGQLIQRQMAIADFAVDKSALDLLRFDHVARRMMSGDEIILGHKGADWSFQTDHLFADNLRMAAASLVAHPAEQQARIMDFAEFASSLDDDIPPALADLFSILGRCKRGLLENPIFWLRLVAYGHACNWLVASQGKGFGLRTGLYDSAALLAKAADASLAANPAQYVIAFDAVVDQGP